MKQLQEAGIHAVFHYIPLHSSPMGQTFGCQDGDLPVTEETSGRLLRLPLFTGMSNDEENFILSRLKQVVEELRRNN